MPSSMHPLIDSVQEGFVDERDVLQARLGALVVVLLVVTKLWGLVGGSFTRISAVCVSRRYLLESTRPQPKLAQGVTIAGLR